MPTMLGADHANRLRTGCELSVRSPRPGDQCAVLVSSGFTPTLSQ